MAAPLKILCVHGVGKHPPGGSWEAEWTQSITRALQAANSDASAVVSFVHHDDIFARRKITPVAIVKALIKLSASLVSAPFRRSRGVNGRVRWTAGMVVLWAEDAALRRETRQRLAESVETEKPDIIVAHSLGSLICYDTFTQPATAHLVAGRVFVTAGSQINNPFISGQFLAGRVLPLPRAKHWYHLYNENDDIFTAPIRIHDDSFTEIETPFDLEGLGDHDVNSYMTQANAVSTLWYSLVVTDVPVAGVRMFAAQPRQMPREVRGAKRRALLIGINEYKNPKDNLEGCVNDVFLVSSILQETGFSADDIRVVLNKRATANSIRERIEWLIDGTRPGDERFLYYSGHGAQLPTYGMGDRTDQMDETLCPHDFDWTEHTCITDDWLCQAYGQLPYETKLVVMFDCCHSGGMTRGAAKVRGLDPPDDIRHRGLRWDAEHQMWVDRELPKSGARALIKKNNRETDDVSARPLGFASALRTLPQPEFLRTRQQRGHLGPYMPVLLYACSEEEVAYEYTHGSIAHGAFTYSMAKTLRQYAFKERRQLSYRQLVRSVGTELTEIGYDQHPAAAGPSMRLAQTIPFRSVRPRRAVKRRKKRRRSKRGRQ